MSGMQRGQLLDGQVVDNDARRRLCPVSQNEVIHHYLRLSRQTRALWASQFGVVATADAATTDSMASASLGDFAVAVAEVNIDDVGGRRRRTVV